MALVFYTFAIFGSAYVIGHSAITLPLREWISRSPSSLAAVFLALVECPACLSAWLGLFSGLAALYYAAATFAAWPSWAVPLAFAFYSAGTSYVLARVTGLIPKPGDSP